MMLDKGRVESDPESSGENFIILPFVASANSRNCGEAEEHETLEKEYEVQSLWQGFYNVHHM